VVDLSGIALTPVSQVVQVSSTGSSSSISLTLPGDLLIGGKTYVITLSVQVVNGTDSAFAQTTLQSGLVGLNSSYYFDTFDGYYEVAKLMMGSANDLQLALYYQSKSDNGSAWNSWQSFIGNDLWNSINSINSINLNDFEVSVAAKGIYSDDTSVFSFNATCADAEAATRILKAIYSNSDAVVESGGYTWTIRDQQVTISKSSSPSDAGTLGSSWLVFPPSFEKAGRNVKVAVVLSIQRGISTAVTVPVVRTVTVTRVTQRSIEVNIKANCGRLGYKIYAAALAPETLLVDMNQITVYKIMVSSILTNDQIINATLVIDNLIASTTYTVYVYTEDLVGNAESLGDVISTAVGATTLCCRQVYFLEAPPLLYYTNSSSYDTYSNNIFTYRLSSAPDTNLTVTPTLLDKVTGTVTSLTPSSFFGGKALGGEAQAGVPVLRQLTGSFVSCGAGVEYKRKYIISASLDQRCRVS
jgi:hypothetical protein